MKMTIYFRKWFMLACAGIVSLSFTGCDDKNKEQNYLYTIGIEDYQYSSVGSGIDLFGPLTYLESLKIPSNLSVNRQTGKMPTHRPSPDSTRKWLK